MTSGKLQIGWAKGDITPPRPTLLQGQFHARLATEVRSPLTATALAFEVQGADGTREQAIMLSCDLAADRFKPDLLAALDGRCPDFDRRKLTVNCTHTHTAPCMTRGWYPEPDDVPDFMNPDEYREWLAQRLADVVTTAWDGRQSGSIARGFTYATTGHCRRATFADGTSAMYGDTGRSDFVGIESYDDHSVHMLFTYDSDAELTGILVNVACPSQCDESDTQISADFWHNVREIVAARYGDAVNLLPQCAPAGDVSPHLLLNQTEEKELRDRLGLDNKGMIARRIAAAIEEGLATASPAEQDVVLAHQVETIHLPRLLVTAEQYETEKRIPLMSDAERAAQPVAFQRLWPFGTVCDLVARYEQQSENSQYQCECHFIRIGDAVFATHPFELFIDFATRIRGRSSALQTFLVQLADGSGDGFYLPTERALSGGGYSAIVKSNWVGPEGGTQLVEATLNGIGSLFPGADYPQTR